MGAGASKKAGTDASLSAEKTQGVQLGGGWLRYWDESSGTSAASLPALRTAPANCTNALAQNGGAGVFAPGHEHLIPHPGRLAHMRTVARMQT